MFQVDGMGANCHVTLGYVPLLHVERLICGLATLLKTDLAFGYMAICEYNSQVSPQDGTSPGYDHILDLDSRYQGEPMFNTCRRLTTLIDQSATWADIHAPPNERVGLKGNLHEHAK